MAKTVMLDLNALIEGEHQILVGEDNIVVGFIGKRQLPMTAAERTNGHQPKPKMLTDGKVIKQYKTRTGIRRLYHPDFKRAITARLNAGESIRIVSRQEGIAETILQHWKTKVQVRSQKIPRFRDGQRRKFTDEQKLTIVKLAKERGNTMAIAREYHISESIIRNWKRKFSNG